MTKFADYVAEKGGLPHQVQHAVAIDAAGGVWVPVQGGRGWGKTWLRDRYLEWFDRELVDAVSVEPVPLPEPADWKATSWSRWLEIVVLGVLLLAGELTAVFVRPVGLAAVIIAVLIGAGFLLGQAGRPRD